MKKTEILERYYGEFVQEKYKDVRFETDNKLGEDDAGLVNRLTEPYFWAWYARCANDGVFELTSPIVSVHHMGFRVRTLNALLRANIINSEQLYALIDADRLKHVVGLGAYGQDEVKEWVKGNR